MEHLLANVYFNECCDVCGNTYPVTLYDIFHEQRLAETWQTVRPGGECNEHRQRLVAVVPAAELAAVMEAWERLATALQARELTFAVSSSDVEHAVSQPGKKPEAKP